MHSAHCRKGLCGHDRQNLPPGYARLIDGYLRQLCYRAIGDTLKAMMKTGHTGCNTAYHHATGGGPAAASSVHNAILTPGTRLSSVCSVLYLYPAGHSDRPPIRYNPPFTTCVRGLCHDSQPRFLPARADRSGVGVSHALLVVAIGARRRSTDTTHARDATTQTLHGAQTLSGSHPETLLRCL